MSSGENSEMSRGHRTLHCTTSKQVNGGHNHGETSTITHVSILDNMSHSVSMKHVRCTYMSLTRDG